MLFTRSHSLENDGYFIINTTKKMHIRVREVEYFVAFDRSVCSIYGKKIPIWRDRVRVLWIFIHENLLMRARFASHLG